MKKFLQQLFHLTPAHRLARKTVKELESLSDKELNDIGIRRGDIYYIAYEDVIKQNKKEDYKPELHYMRGIRQEA